MEVGDDTRDQITVDAAGVTKKHRVSLKCATSIPDDDRITEFKLQDNA